MHREQRERRAERGDEEKGQRDFHSTGKIGGTKPSTAVKQGALYATTGAKILSLSSSTAFLCAKNNVLFLEGETQQIIKKSCSQLEVIHTQRDKSKFKNCTTIKSCDGKTVQTVCRQESKQ